MNRQPRTTDHPIIRLFQPGDQAAFRRLNEAWISKYFRLEQKDREILGDPDTHIMNKGGQIFMAVLDGEPVGCCALLKMNDTTMEVAKMAVDEHHQGHGIGRALLTAVIDYARQSRLQRLYLETNHTLTPALALYQSMGFRLVPEDRIVKSPYQRADVSLELLLPSQ